MAIVDSAPEGGKFRAFAATGLDATAGAWGIGNLLCVSLDASGTLALGTATTTVGVILTSEGKRDNTHANFKKVVGGGRYTVLKRAILVECDQWASPALTAGDVLYAAASGDVTTTPGSGAVLLGYAVKGDGTGGLIFVLDVGGAAVAGAVAPEKSTIILGGAAGNHTVTGIATADTLLSVLYYNSVGPVASNLTAEFTISAANTINNAAGTNTTGGSLTVIYRDATP